jgi:hypothetical protein
LTRFCQVSRQLAVGWVTGVEDVDINGETGLRFMGKVTRSKSVPKNMGTRYNQIVALTDEFCHRHLNDEYRDLAQLMAAALCRK